MMTTVVEYRRQHAPLQIRSVAWSRPLAWVAAGWHDLRQHPAASLAHGALITAFWLVLLAVGGTHPYIIAALLSGFMLIGPVLASGLCELSRRQSSGAPLSFEGSVEGISANSAALMRFSGILAILTVAWFLMSVLVLNTIFHRPEPTLAEVLYGGFLGSNSVQQLGEYLLVGGALALVVLSMSVVAVPVMLDHQAGAGEAIRASLQATWSNLSAIAVWSILLVALVSIGFATALLGLVVIVPLMGHATWHAYVDLVSPAQAAASDSSRAAA
jgi:uncharacterized membrane protein